MILCPVGIRVWGNHIQRFQENRVKIQDSIVGLPEASIVYYNFHNQVLYLSPKLQILIFSEF